MGAGAALIWFAGVRDLRWRARRVLFAVGGAALVFTITLLLSGFRATFDVETGRLISDFGAGGFLVRATAEGPFSTAQPLATSVADEVVASGRAGRADPVITGRQRVTAPRQGDVYVIGHRPGGLASPTVTEGRTIAAPGEIVADRGAGYAIGESLELGGTTFTVVGRVEGRSLFFGIPLVYVHLADAQAVAFGGQALATTVLTDVPVVDAPDGLRALTAAEARDDLTGLFGAAITTVTLLRAFLWTVAAAIIASVLYVSVLERTRDFAVFKATGVATRHLAGAIGLQAVALALAAAAAACVLAAAVRPVFPIPISLPADALARLAGIAVAVGVVAAGAGLRRAVRIEPAAAFRAA